MTHRQGGITQSAIWLVCAIGMVLVIIAVVNYSGIPIPPIIITLAWIVGMVFLAAFAIYAIGRMMQSMGGGGPPNAGPLP